MTRWEIMNGDCVELLKDVERGSVRQCFADSPYNIGIAYDGMGGAKADKLPARKYLDWCGAWMEGVARTLADDGSFWVLICDEWADEFAVLLKKIGLFRRQWIVWFESFGTNHSNGFNRCSRHLLWYVKDKSRFVFNRAAVTRPSDRQVKYGDKRAAPGGKTWDSVWGVNPAIPRLTGTCAERIEGFPTQLPLRLLTPIVGCASKVGDLVLDPFTGSGTTGHAALLLKRRFIGIEQSPLYAAKARRRLESV